MSDDQDVACGCIIAANNVDVFCHTVTDNHVTAFTSNVLLIFTSQYSILLWLLAEYFNAS